MLKVDRSSVMNLENAVRGARNPLASWARGDSGYDDNGNYILGENDLSLAKRLCRAGTDHRKFVRQIFVTADITAPLYWWKEFDTYKVGVTANSTSTMHKLHAREIELTDFSTDRMNSAALSAMNTLLPELESLRKTFVETGDKTAWYGLIQLLPSGYNQMRTCTMNYENAVNMYYARRNHKLDEWHVLCDWILSLPYFKEFFVENGD